MAYLTRDTANGEEAVHHLWDELAEMQAADSDAALEKLMATICRLVDAQNAWWIPALRLDDDDSPALGWRAPYIRYLHEQKVDRKRYVSNSRSIESGSVTETTRKHVARAGRFRSVLLRDHASAEFFASEHYQTNYVARGITDTMYVITPVSRDAESYLCFMRINNDRLFSKADLALATYALRPLKAFQRQLFVSHGLVVGAKPLTPVERRVLHELLTDKVEKQIALTLGLAPTTTHKYVTSVYRKLGVSGRAGLTALWLNRLS